MFNKLIYHSYPFLSFVFLEAGDILRNGADIARGAFDVLIILIQIIVGILTIIKIWKDIQHKKFRSIGQSEKQEKKKHPFLTALLEYLNKSKK
jgi:hypothetical protein